MTPMQHTAASTAGTAVDTIVKRFAVFAAAAGLATVLSDMAITQVGLPSMQAGLGISVTASQWILNVALMMLAGVVTVGGALGDRLGRLRVFRMGILLLIVGAAITFAGGLVSQYGIIMLGRAIEGLGAACSVPAGTALLLDVFPHAERGVAQGRMIVLSMFVAAFAPLVAGVVIQAFGWPYVYFVTMMGGIVTLFLLGRIKYPQIMPATARFDYLGSVLVFLSVTLLITGIMQAGVGGLTSSVVLLLVGMGLVLGIVLVVVSLRKSKPLIQFRLLKIRNVAIAVFVTLMRFLPRVLMSAFLARYAQQVLGLSPATTGLLMIVPVLAQVGAAPIAGRMLDQDGPRAPVSLGVVLLLGGLICLAFGFPAQNTWLVLFGSILGEAGFAFTNPVQMAALNQTPLAQRGMLAGIFPLAGQFGTALWVALLTAGMSTLMVSMVAGDSSMSDATAQANALGMLSWIGAVVTLATLVASLFLRNTRTPPSALVADAKN